MTWLWLSCAWFVLALVLGIGVGSAVQLADDMELTSDAFEEGMRALAGL